MHRQRDRGFGGSNGRGEPGLGLSTGYRVRSPIEGHELAPGTIAEILGRHGIEPAPERSRKTTRARRFLLDEPDR